LTKARSRSGPRGDPPGSGAPEPAEAQRESLLSQKRVIQAGAVAAAIGSILGLGLTVGDRITGAFSHGNATPEVKVDDVKLETMSLQTFLDTKTTQQAGQPALYGTKDLKQTVLVVELAARYAHSPRGVAFPVTYILETRRGDAGIKVVDRPVTDTAYLHASSDKCVCAEWFHLPQRGHRYRVEVQIFSPDAPRTESPLVETTSNWYPL